MLRVMTIVGTRPELIRLSLTIAKLDQFCDHRLVHTGQNYDFELNPKQQLESFQQNHYFVVLKI
jgi:UDP-N-acetylglucosamine 2-epimerase